jgi:lipid II:glycine glycyltransferase (peptidoglycan interpeptide bridge formation enzyme)
MTSPAPTDDGFRLLRDDQQAEWDAFAAAHPNSDFAQAWDWGRLKARGEWRPVRAGLWRDGRMVAGAQVLLRPLPGGKQLAYACRGPLVDLISLDAAADRAAVFDGLEAMARRERAICLKIDPCVPVSSADVLRRCGVVPVGGMNPSVGGTQPKFVMRLDLSPGLDTVFEGFKPDYRNRIRKAPRRGVTVREGATPEEWRGWYDLLLETAARQHFRVRAYSYFEAIRDDLAGSCRSILLLAEREGRQLGGILCLRYGATFWYLYGGMNEEGREHYCGYLLQWAAMQRAAADGCTTYDFRGVAPPDAEDSPLYGLNRFKSGFGPELVEWVGEWDLILSPLWYKAFVFALPRVKALLKRRG